MHLEIYREYMQIKIVNKSHHPLPKYETQQSAGMDLRAYLPEGPITLKPMERGLVKTGLFMELPAGYEAQVRPRSGLALKKGITVLNSPEKSTIKVQIEYLSVRENLKFYKKEKIIVLTTDRINYLIRMIFVKRYCITLSRQTK